MTTAQKYVFVPLGIALFVLLVFSFAKPYNSVPVPIYEKTADQIEQEELVKKIGSGSALWEQHNQAEWNYKQQMEQEAMEKAKIQTYVAGYRVTLCAKFNMVLSESGTLVYKEDCASQSFQ